jgi:hypothetical protein
MGVRGVIPGRVPPCLACVAGSRREAPRRRAKRRARSAGRTAPPAHAHAPRPSFAISRQSGRRSIWRKFCWLTMKGGAMEARPSREGEGDSERMQGAANGQMCEGRLVSLLFSQHLLLVLVLVERRRPGVGATRCWAWPRRSCTRCAVFFGVEGICRACWWVRASAAPRALLRARRSFLAALGWFFLLPIAGGVGPKTTTWGGGDKVLGVAEAQLHEVRGGG